MAQEDPNGTIKTGPASDFGASTGSSDSSSDISEDETLENDQAIEKMTDDEICKMVKEDRDWSYSCFQPYFDKLPSYYNLYRSYSTRTVEQGRSNVFVPYVFTMTENMHARMMSALFSQRPFVRVTPRLPSPQMNEVLSAQKAEVLMDSQMDRPNFYRDMDTVVKISEVFGTAYLKSGWITKKGTRIRRPGRQIDGASQGNMLYGAPAAEQVIMYDGPNVNVYAPGQILPDPTSGPNLQDGDFVVEEGYKSIAYLKQKEREGIYRNTGLVEVSGTAPVFPALTRMAQAGKATNAEPPAGRKMAKIWEGHYRNGWIFTIAEEKFLLKKRKSPFLHGAYPYIPFHFILCMGEPFGIGIGEILEGLQEEMNTTRNQRMDNINFSINKILKVRKGVYADVKAQFPNRPTAIWEVERMDDAEWVRHPEINSSAFSSEEAIKQDSQNAVGVSDYNMGSTNSKLNDTAHGMTIIAEQSASRFKLQIQTLGTSVGEMGDQWNSLNAQFLPDAMTITVENNPQINGGDKTNVTVTPEDLAGNYKFSVQESVVALDKKVDLENKKAVYAEAKAAPFVDQPALLRWYAGIMGASELKPYIHTPPPIVAPAPGMQPQQGGPPPEQSQPQAAEPVPPVTVDTNAATGNEMRTFPSTGDMIPNA